MTHSTTSQPPGPSRTKASLQARDIQRFDDLYSSTPSAILTLAEALDAITEGQYAADIRHVRKVWRPQGEEAYTLAKRRLPQCTFAGTFAPTRTKAHLVQHSGLCHADIDHLADLPTTKQRLQADPHVVYCFTSPRGDGLKYGVHVPVITSDEAYKHAWGTLADAHATAYQVTWDPSGKDVCRLCFVSWDPTCYINLEADVYPMPPPMVIPPAPVRLTTPAPLSREARARYAERGIANAVQIIAESAEGHLHEARCRAGYLLGGYVGGGLLTYGEAYEALRSAVEGHTKHLAPALKTIADCLKAGEAEPITLDALEAEWQSWKEAHARPPVRAALAHRAPVRYATLRTPVYQKAGAR
jgi:hypothetical protein